MDVKFLDCLLNLIFPPHCVSCKEALPFDSTDALCSVCYSRYLLEKGYICPECEKSHTKCQCLPPLMRRYAQSALHLAEYVKEESPTRSMILTAKDDRYEYLYRFLSDEISSLIRKRVEGYGECLMTYVPRSEKKVLLCGVDQAKETARRVAKRLSIGFLSPIYREEGSDQKSLNIKERAKNAKSVFALNSPEESLAGRRIILYDDVVTTGASMAACASLLKKAGAKEVIFVSFGKTYRKGKTVKNDLPKSKKKYRFFKKTPF